MLLSFVAAAVLLLSARWQPSSSAPVATDDSNLAATTDSSVSQGVATPSRPKAGTLRQALYPVIPLDEPVLIVDLSDRQVSLFQSGATQNSYPIAVGQAGWETPSGSFSVLQMQEYPHWRHPITNEVFPPGADNPLGSRWIGFWTDGENQIGFHGTNRADLIGQAVSHGCIRMRDVDVQALYALVSVGTTVIVRP
ncbi:L,D-transpeptidase [Oculatella sp. LEGE 06141]|nr:L,D-transpeptidase [Oculatella sp. LEGE 06141]MBE9180744.1 L,D-transpeptidase [Oculatella sp. LEGE 06141]